MGHYSTRPPRPNATAAHAAELKDTFPDLIEGLWSHGELATLSGLQHGGKTAFYSWALCALLRGLTFLGFPTSPPKAVGVLAADHKVAHNHAMWLHRAGVRAEVQLYSLRDDPKFNWESLRSNMRRKEVFKTCLGKFKLPPGSLLIIDPAALFIANRMNDGNEVAIGLGNLDQTITARGITGWLVAHQSGKALSDPAKVPERRIDRIMGSTSQIGYTDISTSWTPPRRTDEVKRYLFDVDPPRMPPFTRAFLRDAQTGLYLPDESFVDTDDAPPAEEAAGSAAPLDSWLAAVPQQPPGLRYTDLMHQLQDLCGVKRSQAKRVFKTLCLNRQIVKVLDGTYIKPLPS